MSLRLLPEKQILVVQSYQLHAYLFRQKSTNQRNFGPELNFHGSSRADKIYYIFWIKKFCKSVSTFFINITLIPIHSINQLVIKYKLDKKKKKKKKIIIINKKAVSSVLKFLRPNAFIIISE